MGLCPTDISIGAGLSPGAPVWSRLRFLPVLCLAKVRFFGCTALEKRRSALGAAPCLTTLSPALLLRNGSGVIPDGIVHIGAYALRGATGMRTVKLPASLISVGDYAMENMDGLARV